MDVIGTAASIITLAETTKKLYDFWEAVDEAPPQVREIVEDLITLKRLIERIEQEWRSHSMASVSPADEALKSCTNKINRLADMLDMFDFKSTGTWRQRKWSAIKATLKREKIREFQMSLEAAKTSLILAQSLLDSSSASKLCRGIRDLEAKQSNVISTVVSQQTQMTDIQSHVSEIRATSINMIQAIQMQSATLGGSLVNSGLEALVSQAVHNALLDPEMQMALKSLFEKPQDLLPSDPSKRYVSVEAISETTDGSAHRYLHGVTGSIFCNQQNVDATVLHRQAYASSSLSPGEGSARDSKLIPRDRSFRRIVVQKHDRFYKSFSGSLHYHTEIISCRKREMPGSWYSFDSSEEHRVETALRIIPASWLLRYGITISVAKSTNQISTSLCYFPIVPDDALIFQCCKDGDIQAIQSLFQRKLATPWDSDSSGWTPLHYAAWLRHTQLCQMLLDNGADANARDCFQTPPIIRVSVPQRFQEKEEGVNTMRVLVEQGGLDMMAADYCNLSYYHDIFITLSFPVLTWLLRQEAGYFKSDFLNTNSQDLGLLFSHLYLDCEWNTTGTHKTQVEGMLECLEILHNLGVDFNRVREHPRTPSGSRSLHQLVFRFPSMSPNKVDVVIARLISYGANVHELNHSGQTLTLASLKHPQLFHRWREILFGTKDFNLERFCQDEIAAAQLFRDWNWDESALVRLFQLPFPHCKTLYHVYCGKEADVCGYKTWWQRQIASCSPDGKWQEDTPSLRYKRNRFCRYPSDTRKIHLSSTSLRNIIITTRWGHWPCQWTRTVFCKDSLDASEVPSIRRYDILVRIWPSATNNPNPLFVYRRVRNYIVIYLRRWEWCSTILARMS